MPAAYHRGRTTRRRSGAGRPIKPPPRTRPHLREEAWPSRLLRSGDLRPSLLDPIKSQPSDRRDHGPAWASYGGAVMSRIGIVMIDSDPRRGTDTWDRSWSSRSRYPCSPGDCPAGYRCSPTAHRYHALEHGDDGIVFRPTAGEHVGLLDGGL